MKCENVDGDILVLFQRKYKKWLKCAGLLTLKYRHRSVLRKKHDRYGQLPYRQGSNGYHSRHNRNSQHGKLALEHASPIPMSWCLFHNGRIALTRTVWQRRNNRMKRIMKTMNGNCEPPSAQCRKNRKYSSVQRWKISICNNATEMHPLFPAYRHIWPWLRAVSLQTIHCDFENHKICYTTGESDRR